MYTNELFREHSLVINRNLRQNNGRAKAVLNGAIRRLAHHFVHSSFRDKLHRGQANVRNSRSTRRHNSNRLLTHPGKALRKDHTAPLQGRQRIRIMPSRQRHIRRVLLRSFTVHRRYHNLNANHDGFKGRHFLTQVKFGRQRAGVGDNLLRKVQCRFTSAPNEDVQSNRRYSRFRALNVFDRRFRQQRHGVQDANGRRFRRRGSSLSGPRRVIVVIKVVPTTSATYGTTRHGALYLVRHKGLRAHVGRRHARHA